MLASFLFALIVFAALCLLADADPSPPVDDTIFRPDNGDLFSDDTPGDD